MKWVTLSSHDCKRCQGMLLFVGCCTSLGMSCLLTAATPEEGIDCKEWFQATKEQRPAHKLFPCSRTNIYSKNMWCNFRTTSWNPPSCIYEKHLDHFGLYPCWIIYVLLKSLIENSLLAASFAPPYCIMAVSAVDKSQNRLSRLGVSQLLVPSGEESCNSALHGSDWTI